MVYALMNVATQGDRKVIQGAVWAFKTQSAKAFDAIELDYSFVGTPALHDHVILACNALRAPFEMMFFLCSFFETIGIKLPNLIEETIRKKLSNHEKAVIVLAAMDILYPLLDCINEAIGNVEDHVHKLEVSKIAKKIEKELVLSTPIQLTSAAPSAMAKMPRTPTKHSGKGTILRAPPVTPRKSFDAKLRQRNAMKVAKTPLKPTRVLTAVTQRKKTRIIDALNRLAVGGTDEES